MDGRLILDGAGSGSWNMALDQALLEHGGAAARPCLRFYHWEPATVSLGYFQSYASRASHEESRKLACVRRHTGGGALIHDGPHEITYSLILPTGDRFSGAAQQLVSSVHHCLVNSLATLGIRVEMVTKSRDDASPPFLCFLRRAESDLTADGSKIAGSAQRRTRSAAMIHGSLLLSGSEFAPELPGLAEITGKTVEPDQLQASWIEELAATFGFRLEAGPIPEQVIKRARELCVQRYNTDGWNQRR